MKQIYFSNLPFTTPEDYLRNDVFSTVGKVESCRLFKMKDGRSRGEGLVSFADNDGAQRCLDKLNDANVDGRQMMVKLHEDREGRGRKMQRRDGEYNNFNTSTSADGQGNNNSDARSRNSSARLRGNSTSAPVNKNDASRRNNSSAGAGPVRMKRNGTNRATPYRKNEVVKQEQKSGGSRNSTSTPAILYFTNVPYETNEDEIRTFFADVGKIKRVTMFKFNDGRFTGKGLIEFTEHSAVDRAMEELDRLTLHGRRILLHLEEPSQLRNVATVYFHNVPFDTAPDAILDLFRGFGENCTLTLMRTPRGQSRGQGWVKYDSVADAKRAVSSLNDVEVDGRNMGVKLHDEGEIRNNATSTASTPRPPPRTPRNTPRGGSSSTPNSNNNNQRLDRSVKSTVLSPSTTTLASKPSFHSSSSRRKTKATPSSSSSKARRPSFSTSNGGDIDMADRGSTTSTNIGREGEKIISDRCVFVKNIGTSTAVEYIWKLFSECGPCTVKRAPYSRAMTYKCWVEYDNNEDATEAIATYNEASIDDHVIHAQFHASVYINGIEQGARVNSIDVDKATLSFSNIPTQTTEEFMHGIFNCYGSCELKLHRENGAEDGVSLGTGSVSYQSIDDTIKAQEELHGALVDGVGMDVTWGDPNRPKAEAVLREEKRKVVLTSNANNNGGEPLPKSTPRRPASSNASENGSGPRSARGRGGDTRGRGGGNNERDGGQSLFPANGCTCYFRNINKKTNEAELRQLFGEVSFCQVVIHRGVNGESRGEGWALFKSTHAASQAVKILHGMEVDGNTIQVYIHEGDKKNKK